MLRGWRRMRGKLLAALSAIALLVPVWGAERVEAGSTISKSVVVVRSAELYPSPEKTGQPLGVVSGIQQVDVDWGDWEEDGRKPEKFPQRGDWIRVKTWLGPAWIEDGAGVLYGGYDEERGEAHLLNTVELYNTPVEGDAVGAWIAPQKLKVTGTISFQPKDSGSARQFAALSGEWLRIETWLGDKWIYKPALMEKMNRKEQSYALKLTGEAKAYPLPHVEGPGETIPAGVVHVTASAWEGRDMGSPHWYEIEWNGEKRWIPLGDDAWIQYRTLKRPIRLTEATDVHEKPRYGVGGAELPPGTYEAIEATGPWVHVKTADGTAWVDMERALLRQRERAVWIEEDVKLSEKTESYYYPQTGDVYHAKGFFSPQTVKSFERWTAEDGEVWYHIQTAGGAEWVNEDGVVPADAGEKAHAAAEGTAEGK
ncbi:hypothetical protein [Paenibacillus flagellatus]|uniref:Uncharacterized protein n=1 Tax=Paenibacillus flagellatus TaxID=2211139 RepID=A0A2V5JZ97_9BACL|nr:hypothetical protein [Paenibacillus flagellatus]PYI50513.1 hypothetical protein DLM86_28855 [Paenibacillus flagellatus]